jgi:hypothetical protein
MLIAKLKWIYRAYRYRLRLEPQEIKLLLQNFNPDDVGVDVGAHKADSGTPGYVNNFPFLGA